MSIADTSRGVLRYIEEVTPGVTPAAALTEVRFTGESLNQNQTNEISNEIRADRQITDLIATDSDPAGEYNYELSYDNLDDFIPAALLSSGWSTAVAISETDFEVIAGDSSYNTVLGDFTLEGLEVGMWIKPAGFSDAENNDFCQVVSITANKLVISGSTLVDEAGVTGTFTNDGMARNGVTPHSFTLEKEFSDIGQFISYTGYEVATMTLEISSNAIITGTVGFIGRNVVNAQTSVGVGAPIAAPENDVFNATSNIASIREDGVALATFATGLSISLDNSFRSQKAVSVNGNVGVGKGRCNLTGTLNSYFGDDILIDKFLTNTASSVAVIATDSAGNSYIITIPKIKYTSGNPEISSGDADVPLDLDYQGLRDPATDATIQIDKFSA